MTKHETSVQALIAALTPISADVIREEVLPVRCPDNGVVNVVPADPEEAGFVLGAALREYERMVQLELVVTHTEPAQRIARFEALLVEIGNVLQPDLSLGGQVDFLRISAPVEAETIPMEGAAALKGATVEITLFYETSDNPMEVTS